MKSSTRQNTCINFHFLCAVNTGKLGWKGLSGKPRLPLIPSSLVLCLVTVLWVVPCSCPWYWCVHDYFLGSVFFYHHLQMKIVSLEILAWRKSSNRGTQWFPLLITLRTVFHFMLLKVWSADHTADHVWPRDTLLPVQIGLGTEHSREHLETYSNLTA